MACIIIAFCFITDQDGISVSPSLPGDLASGDVINAVGRLGHIFMIVSFSPEHIAVFDDQVLVFLYQLLQNLYKRLCIMIFNIVLHQPGIFILIYDTIVIIKDKECFLHAIHRFILGKRQRIKELEVYHQDNEHLHADKVGKNCRIIAVCAAG